MWDFLVDFWPLLLGLLDVVVASAATSHIVLRKRDTRAVIAWTGLVWLAPILGALAYVCFGINRIQRKAVSLGVARSWRPRSDPRVTPEDVAHGKKLTADHPNLRGLANVVEHATGRPLLPGNRIDPLRDGDEAYPAMLKAIDEAERSVAMLSYIFDSDRAGDAFFEALSAAKDRGLEVRVLIDDVGARYSKPNMIRRLESAGLAASGFLPTRVPRMFKYANLRNHRKILITDGRVGFTGGTNIREGHWLKLNPKSPIQCLHFRLTGPVVAQLQEAFAVDWAFATDESLEGDLWFPEIEHAGPVWARGVPDGPDEDFEKLTDTLLGGLSAATSRVRIVTPYFLPHAPLIHALNVTAMRGVTVDVVMPDRNNIPPVQWAATAQAWQMLEKGCRIHLTPPPFDHTKLMVVDGVWSLIGSTNWDPRSLRLNFEYNVECYDDGLAARLDKLIEAKIAAAHRLTLEQVNARSFPVQLRDGLARVLTPYM